MNPLHLCFQRPEAFFISLLNHLHVLPQNVELFTTMVFEVGDPLMNIGDGDRTCHALLLSESHPIPVIGGALLNGGDRRQCELLILVHGSRGWWGRCRGWGMLLAR